MTNMRPQTIMSHTQNEDQQLKSNDSSMFNNFVFQPQHNHSFTTNRQTDQEWNDYVKLMQMLPPNQNVSNNSFDMFYTPYVGNEMSSDVGSFSLGNGVYNTFSSNGSQNSFQQQPIKQNNITTTRNGLNGDLFSSSYENSYNQLLFGEQSFFGRTNYLPPQNFDTVIQTQNEELHKNSQEYKRFAKSNFGVVGSNKMSNLFNQNTNLTQQTISQPFDPVIKPVEKPTISNNKQLFTEQQQQPQKKSKSQKKKKQTGKNNKQKSEKSKKQETTWVDAIKTTKTNNVPKTVVAKPTVQKTQKISHQGKKLSIVLSEKSKNFDCSPKFARFFVIKSYSEDDVHKSIKYGVWASTETGNKRLAQAWKDSSHKGPIYLFFSVNGSRQFCGLAEMKSNVDFNAKLSYWVDDKWTGQFSVEWIFIKDIPNYQFRHIILENNEYKPVTKSRDTQEVPFEQGRDMLKIFSTYKAKLCLLDDFEYYDEIEKNRLKNNSYQIPKTDIPPRKRKEMEQQKMKK